MPKKGVGHTEELLRAKGTGKNQLENEMPFLK